MTRSLVLIAVLVCSGLVNLACVEHVPAPPERVATFQVQLDFSQSPQPGVLSATCTFEGGTDLCPGGAGDLENRIPYPGEQYAQFRVTIAAVSSKGNVPFKVNGPISITTGVCPESTPAK